MDLQPAVMSHKSQVALGHFSLFFAGRVFFLPLLSLCDCCCKEWLCGFPSHP